MEKEVAPMNQAAAAGVIPVDARAVPRNGKAQGLDVPRYFTTPGVDPARRTTRPTGRRWIHFAGRAWMKA